jgi:Na+-driven multidrug efflux pump
MLPIGQFIMTWITSHFGDVVIGAITAAQRVQAIAFFFPMSLGVSLMPMIGQNYGARLYSRINGCRRFAMRFAFLYLMTMSVLFFIFAPEIAGKFLADDKVEMRAVMAFALRILPWGFAFLEAHRYSGFFFTGCGRPMAAAMLNVMRILGFLVPLSLLVLLYFRLTGNEDTALTLLLVSQMAADVFAGTIAMILARRLTRRFPADGVSNPFGWHIQLFKNGLSTLRQILPLLSRRNSAR